MVKQPIFIKKTCIALFVHRSNVFVMNHVAVLWWSCFTPSIIKALKEAFYSITVTSKKDSKGTKRYFSRLLCGRLISRKRRKDRKGEKNAFRFRISLKDSQLLLSFLARITKIGRILFFPVLSVFLASIHVTYVFSILHHFLSDAWRKKGWVRFAYLMCNPKYRSNNRLARYESSRCC